MHIYFPVTGRRARPAGAQGRETVSDPGQLMILRDPEDESEWQYLGNPEVAASTTLADVVGRFIQDCSDEHGVIPDKMAPAALGVRDALLHAARQIDEALKNGRG